jgi:oligogalacturonide lyase
MHFRQIRTAACLASLFCAAPAAFAQVGRTWPSEKKIAPDPVSGLPLTFLTSSETYHQSKIYQTHRQRTSDGKWLIFRGITLSKSKTKYPAKTET